MQDIPILEHITSFQSETQENPDNQRRHPEYYQRRYNDRYTVSQ